MVYVIGKEYQMTYDFTGIQSSFYPYVNLGIIMLLAACGFSYIGFSVIEKEVNRGPVYKILFALNKHEFIIKLLVLNNPNFITKIMKQFNKTKVLYSFKYN